MTSSVSNGQYTVSNVQSDFTLEAFFEEGTTPAPQPQTQDKGTANLSIESFEIKAGETKTMLIDMQNPDDQVTMVQFDLRLPDGLSIATGDDAVDIAGRTTWRKHTLTSKADNGLTRILLYSATNEVVDGTSGAIISIKLKASSTFKGGDVKLENQLMTTPSLVESKPSTYTYNIKGTETPVGDGEPYVVYNNGTLTFYCDKKRSSRQGTVYDLNKNGYDRPAWLENNKSITKVVFDPTFANARPTTTYSWFAGCSAMTDIEGIAYLNTNEVTFMFYMFAGCSSLTSLDLSNFNTSNVTSMGLMFNECSSLKNLDVSNFNTAKVTDMEMMFCLCTGLTSLDLSSFNTSNVTGMQYIFSECNNLIKLTLGSGFATTENLDINRVFSSCYSLKTVAFTGDIPSIINSKFFEGVGTSSNPATLEVPDQYRDHYAAKFDGNKFFGGYFKLSGDNPPAGDGEPYVVYNNGTLTFYCDNKRSSRQGTVYDLEQKRNGGPAWLENSNSVTKAIFDPSFANARPKTTASWFYKCSAMADIEGIAYLNTSNVSNMMLMFYFCSSLTSLDVSDFNTSNVTNMMDMFCACSGLKSLDVSKFNTSNVTNMSAMFHQCSGLTILDVSNFNTSNVTNMSMLFDRCSGLTSLDVSKFDTSNVTDIHQMFNRCSGLTSLNISNFNTSNVTDMSYMFSNCSGLTRLDVSNFNTSNVTNMWNMFGDCSNLTSLDLSNFNTSNVTDMGQMFSGCTKLTKLTLGNRFVTPEQTGCNNVFKYSNSLNTIAYTGDIPSSINSKFFEGVGTSSNPATLEVPAQYRDHYAVKFDGNKFFGGYFKLSGKTDTSEDYITFACPVAKSICIQNWDTDGDGKLSKTEAAAVTDLGKVFQKTDVTSLDELKYFTGLISIPKGCFWQCTKLRSVIIPANVSMLGSWLFQECHSLERIEVDVNNPNFESPEGCNAIITKGSRKELLYGCKNTLIPEGVTDIKYYAFAYNEGIESIHIPASVRNIDGQSFSLCPNLNTITVDPDNKYYDSRNDCNAIINTDTNQLIVGSNSTIIPEGVAGIGYYAFGGRLIKSIMLPQSVKTIGRLAFSVCYNLEEVRLSEGLESIGGYSFQSCESLNKINIPSTVVSIEEGAFNLAKGIEVIWSYIEKPFAVTNAFDSDCYKNATLYVPFGTKSTYETTEGWKNFKNIVEMDGSEPTDTKPYAVYNDFTLTFYCDDQRSKRSGAVYNLNEGEEDPDWVLDSNNRNVEKVVFDASFANARPTTTYRWFLSCDILREIVGIENLNTSEVKNMQNMFGFCEFLKSVDVSHFDTKLVQNMGGMFYYCTSLESIDVSHFDTNNVWSMASMFSQCKSLTEVNLSSFNTSKVEYLSRLFKGCSNLKTVYLGSGFVSDNNVEIEDIFADCQNLSKVVFTGDIPYSIHGTLFEGVGTASKPAMLDVPKQYIANYKAKFNGNMFYGGYFTLREAIVPDEKGDKDYGSGNSEINEKTDLDGTVIGNVYYSIAPEHGGYNSAEGCLVVTQPSSDGGFDAEDPFGGDDFKGMFTGIVIMVQPGTGTVKVEAETLGGMTQQVKVGNGLPIEMTLNSKSTLNIPYSVDRPTYVYIYAGGTSGVRSRAGSDAALKIYGISWESSASAITAPVGEERLYDVYSISGKLVKRRATSLDALPKGVYIVNGRKVFVK